MDRRNTQRLFKDKESFADATMLHHPLQDAPTSLTVDASDIVVGVLEQFAGGVWRLLAFFSRQLRTLGQIQCI